MPADAQNGTCGTAAACGRDLEGVVANGVERQQMAARLDQLAL